MDKKEAVKKLREADYESGFANVICDISRNGQVVYPNESILVQIYDTTDNDGAVDDDQIINRKHYTICDNIEDFDENVVFGEEEARKTYCRYYVSDIKDVVPFVSDFDEYVKPSISELELTKQAAFAD